MLRLKKFLFILPLFLFFSTSFVNASIWENIKDEDQGGLTTIGKEVIGQEVPKSTIPQIIGKIIKYLLTFLGVIFITLVIYGGFIYMLAGGGSDKIAEAKSIIVNASVGLAIVMAAYSFTYFIIEAITKSTGTN